MGVPFNRQQLMFQGVVLNDKDKLNEKGVKEGELLYLVLAPIQQPKPPQQQQPKPTMNLADMIRNFDKKKKEQGEFFYQEKPVE